MSKKISHSLKKESERKWQEAGFSNNFIFQKFMQNPDNCKKILTEILGMEISKIEYPEYEKTFDISYDSKSIRLDVYVEGDSTVYNIEMQNSVNAFIPKRSRYYQGTIDLDLLEKGGNYNALNKSIIIFICTFDFYHLDYYKYTFTYQCNEVDGLEFGDETSKIIINSKGHKGAVSDDFKNFMKAINGHFNSSPFSVKLKSELDKIKSNDTLRREFVTLYLHEQEIAQKSRAEGKSEERELAVRNMLKKLSPEDIIELGYEKELIEKILEENN